MAFFWPKVQKTTTPPPPKGHFLTICFFCLRASWPQAYAVWSVINEWRWWCCCERKDDLWELSIIIDNVMAFLSFSHLKLFGQNEQTWKNSLAGRIAVKRQNTLNPKTVKSLGKKLVRCETRWTRRTAVCVPGHFRVWHRNHAPNPLPSRINWSKREYSILQKRFSWETCCSWSPLSVSKSRGLHWFSLQTYAGKPFNHGHPYPF